MLYITVVDRFAFATRKRVGWHLDIQRPTFLFPVNEMDPDGMLMVSVFFCFFSNMLSEGLIGYFYVIRSAGHFDVMLVRYCPENFV